ncbi:lipopolysaccharide transport periplasmic protein LptA [Aliarcobacter butzleri]|uniref:Lipopolysaccharide transport periplasmic protein LptA n=1 Tax=Aliarcobacter butzleri TaxID=28197 RepID=A0AAP4PMT8_9BACT|nr:lipopolysaccharide transport periplasmic protein LptA [Aliarcobacter butzleri]MCP3649096.1 lipopolysaccharide transport periplasmic protein LptA [Arcobacter sp. DNRA7]KLD97872.1 organic solvent tolerance protein OstA [Aliarcobacter butzleri L349]MCG3657785.1 lipopolysaccharide transport periplasmic protein LptA [Aliarcobacter butzleri]MCG3662316.1 lipopolysaccharide transport periplasmic protein LptA [Aliarcobacter butzleri]MCG3669436.1 lipopolysaccharide transport periplasmic protein LptA 
MKKYLIGTLFCSALLFAQSETLIIDAQDFQADDKKGISIFTGNVKIKMGEDKLNAQRVDVFFETDKKTNNKTPLRYEATGKADFEIVTKDKHYVGNGDKIIYSPQKEEYTIIGNGFIHEQNDDRKIYGDTIYVNQLSGEAKVKGSENKPVKFIINVDRGNKETK